MQQENLWHDTLEDALRAVVDVIGGPKKVASALWPAKTITEAARFLHRCLEEERAEKLHLHEFLWIMREGRKAKCHIAMAFLADACDYELPVPKDPKDELAGLHREFIDATKKMEDLTNRIQRTQKKVDG